MHTLKDMPLPPCGFILVLGGVSMSELMPVFCPTLRLAQKGNAYLHYIDTAVIRMLFLTGCGKNQVY